MTLLDELKIRISDGLKRYASVKCSQWVQNYVVLGKPVPGPARFDRHPWTKYITDLDVSWAAMKAAQMGLTQIALHRSIYTIDIKRISVLYFLPKRNPDAVDFSRSKFDSLLNLSPHIEALFSNVRNVGHKQAGNVDFFLRGFRSRSGLKSISTGMKVYDEYDEMVQKNVALAEERSSGFETADKQDIKISTPTLPGFGIAKVIEEEAAEHHYFFKCPRCDKWIEWTGLEQLIITAENLRDITALEKSHMVCPRKECGKPIPHEAKVSILAPDKAKWWPVRNRNSPLPGFQIPQFYSTVMQPWEIAKSVLRARDEPDYEQELWNSKLGLPFEPKGAAVHDADIIRCYGGYSTLAAPPQQQLITMGIDVGHHELYCILAQWLIPPQFGRPINSFAMKKILAAKMVPNDFNELDALMYQYQVNYAVIDVEPYTRDALDFALRYRGQVSLCRFVSGVEKNLIVPQATDETIHINRTSWLDVSQGRFKKANALLLPNDISEMFRKHVKALTRVIREDKHGELRPNYISKGPDHFALAGLYCDVALPMSMSSMQHEDIGKFL